MMKRTASSLSASLRRDKEDEDQERSTVKGLTDAIRSTIALLQVVVEANKSKDASLLVSGADHCGLMALLLGGEHGESPSIASMKDAMFTLLHKYLDERDDERSVPIREIVRIIKLVGVHVTRMWNLHSDRDELLESVRLWEIKHATTTICCDIHDDKSLLVYLKRPIEKLLAFETDNGVALVDKIQPIVADDRHHHNNRCRDQKKDNEDEEENEEEAVIGSCSALLISLDEKDIFGEFLVADRGCSASAESAKQTVSRKQQRKLMDMMYRLQAIQKEMDENTRFFTGAMTSAKYTSCAVDTFAIRLVDTVLTPYMDAAMEMLRVPKSSMAMTELDGGPSIVEIWDLIVGVITPYMNGLLSLYDERSNAIAEFRRDTIERAIKRIKNRALLSSSP